MIDLTTLGADIRRRRKSLGWNQETLAGEAKIGRMALWRIESNKSYRTATLEKVLDALARGELVATSKKKIKR